MQLPTAESNMHIRAPRIGVRSTTVEIGSLGTKKQENDESSLF